MSERQRDYVCDSPDCLSLSLADMCDMTNQCVCVCLQVNTPTAQRKSEPTEAMGEIGSIGVVKRCLHLQQAWLLHR